jgi:hypothetical protein
MAVNVINSTVYLALYVTAYPVVCNFVVVDHAIDNAGSIAVVAVDAIDSFVVVAVDVKPAELL